MCTFYFNKLKNLQAVEMNLNDFSSEIAHFKLFARFNQPLDFTQLISITLPVTKRFTKSNIDALA